MDRLYWDIYTKDPEGFSHFIEETMSFLHIYLGDLREAVAHTDQISKFGRVIYNESAWDTEKFTEIKEDLTRADHYEVIKEVMLRVDKYNCKKVDVGYLGRWKNPYQIAETHMPTGIAITYEDLGDMFMIRNAFFGPEHWFNIQCKPLFKTDPIVAKDPKGSWNMNSVGLIAAKPEKCAGNRRALFNMISDFVKEFNPIFMSLAPMQTYFNAEMNSAYLMDPSAKDNEELLPLIYSFRERSNMLHSDSTPIPKENYKSIQAQSQKLFYDKKHFDFF